MSKIILGTARTDQLTSSRFSKLLDESFTQGIRVFDTAPSYGEAENRLAYWVKSNRLLKEVQVTTKFGKVELESTTSLIRAVNRLQKLFDLDCVQCIFIHSLPLHEINKATLTEFISLRTKGELGNLGYSGDNQDLETAIKMDVFDSVMCTNNLVDNLNLTILESTRFKGEIYAKRVMANYAWSKENYLKQKILRRHNWVVEEYMTRIEKYLKSIPRQKLALEFTRYALVASRMDYSIFGVSSIKHLRQLISLKEQLSHEGVQEIMYETVCETAIT